MREKIVASSSKQLLIVVDESKIVSRLFNATLQREQGTDRSPCYRRFVRACALYLIFASYSSNTCRPYSISDIILFLTSAWTERS